MNNVLELERSVQSAMNLELTALFIGINADKKVRQ